MKTFLFIHGAWASKNSFNFINSQLNKKYNISIFHEYDTINSTVPEVIEEIKKKLDQLQNVTLVGHSLGGIIALSLESHPNVKEVVTIASPISGIKINKIAQSFITFRAPILKSIMSDSAFMYDLKTGTYTKPIKIFVANKGFNPAIYEKSDGVVTFASQTDWLPETGEHIMIESSHHEILQSYDLTKNLTS